MPKAGNKRKPSHLRVVDGNAGRRNTDRVDPEYPAVDELPKPPRFLKTKAAKEEWNKLLPHLMEQGVVTDVDLSMFGMLCQMWGEFVKQANSGQQVNAAFRNQLRQAYAEFGLTPASRSGTSAGKANKRKNGFAGLK